MFRTYRGRLILGFSTVLVFLLVTAGAGIWFVIDAKKNYEGL